MNNNLIQVEELINLTKNRRRFKSEISKSYEQYRSFLKRVVSDNNMNLSMPTMILSEANTLYFNPSSFVCPLLLNLNLDREDYNNNPSNTYIEDNEEEIKQKLEELRMIKTEEELKDNYPFIYKRYNDSKDIVKKLEDMKEMIEKSDSTTAEKIRWKTQLLNLYHNNEKIFNMCKRINKKLSLSTEAFCNSYANTLEALVDYSNEIINYLYENSIEVERLGIPKENLELYLKKQPENIKVKHIK